MEKCLFFLESYSTLSDDFYLFHLLFALVDFHLICVWKCLNDCQLVFQCPENVFFRFDFEENFAQEKLNLQKLRIRNSVGFSFGVEFLSQTMNFFEIFLKRIEFSMKIFFSSRNSHRTRARSFDESWLISGRIFNERARWPYSNVLKVS